jgi:hypothetical protein
MSFVIEDADDDDDYSFQPKWGGGGGGGGGATKSYFGAQDNDMDGGDEYNFDFGKTGKKVTKSPQSWKADKPDVRSSYGGAPSAAPAVAATSAVRSSAPANVMDKAASMLAKYANPPQKRPNQPAKNKSFDINDISLDSSGSSEESGAFQNKNKYEMSFSPPETMFSPEDRKKKTVSPVVIATGYRT